MVMNRATQVVEIFSVIFFLTGGFFFYTFAVF